MKKLLVYLKDYKKETIMAPLFKMLEALLELFVPLVVAAIIDTGIAGGDSSYIIRMVLVLVVLAAVGLGFSITAQYFSAKAAVGFVTRLRHVLFSHIQKLSYSQLDEQGTSTLITRMTSDMNQVQSGVNLTLRLLLRSPFIVIGSMIMAFTVDVKSALVFVVDIPLLAVAVFVIMFAGIPLYRKVQSRLDSVMGLTRENLNGVRVLRAFCKEEEQTAKFRKRNQELTDFQKFSGKISALLNPVTYVIVNGAIIALIWVGAIRVNRGNLSQGEVVALYNYMAQILTELIKLANLIISLTKCVACGNRIQAVLEIQPEMAEESAAGEAAAQASAGREVPVVEFCGASMRYAGAGAEALSDISFAAYSGETIGVIGGTGSGKTTLVNLIPRFYDCCRGAVRVDGKDVREYEKDELRARIGVVPQKAVLFSGTIRSNLLWGKKEADEEELRMALRDAQALDITDRKEQGLDAPVSQGGRNFSGGQRQRLTIARALVRRPEILILDDSSSALDFATDAALRRSIAGMDPKPVLFIVSQRTSSIRHADTILVLEDGRAVGMGTHGELLKSCGVYREIYESQYGPLGDAQPDRMAGQSAADGRENDILSGKGRQAAETPPAGRVANGESRQEREPTAKTSGESPGRASLTGREVTA